MGDGDGSESDESGDFQVRRRISAKKVPVPKVVSVDSDSDGSDAFEVCVKNVSKKKSRVQNVCHEDDDVTEAVVEKNAEEQEFFCTPPEKEQEKMLEALDGVELRRIDVSDELADALGFDPKEFVAYVEAAALE
jgi:hypothetical protein